MNLTPQQSAERELLKMIVQDPTKKALSSVLFQSSLHQDFYVLLRSLREEPIVHDKPDEYFEIVEKKLIELNHDRYNMKDYRYLGGINETN